ncbi:hypothetical protein [Ruminococcus sp.]|uniref:hypothetical protein n=1 Tax=Ruminococcus sp. TaxID=41978 RepID=UPI0026007350|nr:hypothetical protein [Ruminococcus sp.]MCR4640133.1 hypothetical protein [Ruminococcus sp.]
MKVETVEELEALLNNQVLPEQTLLKLLGKYVNSEREKGTDENTLLISLYKYGYICGQRAERKRRLNK